MYRQGDVLIVPAPKLPLGKPLKTNVLAEGEITGHAHRLEGDGRLVRSGEELYLEVRDRSTLTHEEHGPVTLPKGLYQVIQQREFAPWLLDRSNAIPSNPLAAPTPRQQPSLELRQVGRLVEGVARASLTLAAAIVAGD
ncbi:MAG: hypothetical protein HY319_29760 [Armatimonadetes bacterium]|nr:hypothetical protein [Armatimonadota bacterium]